MEDLFCRLETVQLLKKKMPHLFASRVVIIAHFMRKYFSRMANKVDKEQAMRGLQLWNSRNPFIVATVTPCVYTF